MFNSKIKQSDVNKEKQVVISELYQYLDNPSLSVIKCINSCFEGHPLQHDIIGTEQHVLNFDSKTKNTIKNFMSFYMVFS